jgi:hypothetical protein
MFLELSTFKNSTINNSNDIEKFHHNCKVEEVKVINQSNFRFGNIMKLCMANVTWTHLQRIKKDLMKLV